MSSRRRYSATILISAGSSADAVYSALRPDIVSSPDRQVSTSIRRGDDDLAGSIRMELASDDLSHLRAALNSYLRLAGAALRCLDATRL